MKERIIEKRLRLGVEALNGVCYKFVSPGHNGVPDRLIVFPFADPHMAETKAPKKDATEQQVREHERLRRCQMRVWLLNSIGRVDNYLEVMTKAHNAWLAGF